jgi:2-haloalkanoic acid dehalogenase type II
VTATARYEAVLFDLLSALLDSWTLWADVAGDEEVGRSWRDRYLQVTYAVGDYVTYETLVERAAVEEGLDPSLAHRLVERWDELVPWPEAPGVVGSLRGSVRVGVVTNCSVALGERAAAAVGAPFDVVVTAEEAGAYKPRPEPYLRAVRELGLPIERVLFVAGSRYDLAGAGAVGLDVWWHNRVGLPGDADHPPVAEHQSLVSLPDFLHRGVGAAD